MNTVMCDQCRRPVARHGRKAKHQRPCGPQSGTAAGPMSEPERERYLAAGTTPGIEFRWQYWDAALGEEWSDWHVMTGPCAACCCGGPEDGEHMQASEYYDEDGILSNGHARLDPRNVEGWVVEWRPCAYLAAEDR